MEPNDLSEDFPAAHSMDTRWFAVDADGHVAMVDSGPEGPVPRAYQAAFGTQTYLELITDRAPRDEYGHPLIEGDALAVQRRCVPGAIVDEVERAVRSAGRAPADDPDFATIPAAWQPGVFLVLRDASVAADFDGDDFGDVLAFREDPRVIFIRRISLGRLWDAFRAGRVLGAAFIDGEWDDRDVAMAMGLYVYDERGSYDRDGAAPVYRRVRVPTRPLDATALPGELPSRLPRLPVSFAALPRLQPAEYVPCRGWGSDTWRSLDGEERHFDEPYGDEDAAPPDDGEE